MPPGIDVDPVSAWLVEHVEGLAAPFRFEPIGGGRSNLTYLVTDDSGHTVVLRRPPLGSVLATAHDMAREHRVIAALAPTAVPVPDALAVCTDDAISGAPFYVMSHVEGVVLDSQAAAADLATDVRRRVAEDLIDVLADLHAVDVDEVGLGDLARRDDYVERQLKRWSRQWADSKTRQLPAVEEVAARLARRIPAQRGVVVAHGDYRLGNCLTNVDAGRIAAVLDWELCTLGDPLADVGYLGVTWTDPDAGGGRHNDPSGLDGFPTYAELLERYARRTGRDVSGVAYYVAFSSWRLAVISEGVYARYLHGAMGDGPAEDVLDTFRQNTEDLAAGALAALEQLA
ncbi:MAG: phosphotransferase family protein [Acidimicrobiia bacterium]|nr:phosphotransferase family protein [Acidimicrobiia bacterium]